MIILRTTQKKTIHEAYKPSPDPDKLIQVENILSYRYCALSYRNQSLQVAIDSTKEDFICYTTSSDFVFESMKNIYSQYSISKKRWAYAVRDGDKIHIVMKDGDFYTASIK
jgi:hypothetical protein